MKNKNQVIADQVIALMKTAGNDWSSGLINGNATPVSLATGKQYSGGNWLTLSVQQQLKKYDCSTWGTFLGYKKAGLYVRKGEKATPVRFFKTSIIKDAQDKESFIRTNKTYNLFNGDQVEGYEYEKPASVTNTESTSVKIADSFSVDCGASIKNVDDKTAYYSIKNDFINLPKIELFESGVSYAGYLLHELAHWSGHKTRLDRFTEAGTSYPFEELVAELGATMLLSQLGIEKTPRVDHAQYLNSWIRMLENKPDSILRAANKAAQATEFLSSLQLGNQEKLAA
jgi:antirestriction protein ArdC|tara:strand:+ start:1156 stop:2010 length:855 start_codon:yes stop_codon:yes gene_type:complete